jgi:THO complex subunit 2
MIWSVDTELDELLNEARAASAVSADQSTLSTKDLAAIISKARKAQQNAENDKQRIQAIVKKLLVRPFLSVTYSDINVT